MKFAFAAVILSIATGISAIKELVDILEAESISRYTVSSREVVYNVTEGEVSKKRDSGDDVTTLMTFYFGSQSKGKRCQFMFETNGPDAYTVQGGPQPWEKPRFQVFWSQKPVRESKPPGQGSNFRDNFIGTLEAVIGGNANKVDYQNLIFQCPEGPESKGFEMVPTGDEMKIKWTQGNDGPYIRYFV